MERRIRRSDGRSVVRSGAAVVLAFLLTACGSGQADTVATEVVDETRQVGLTRGAAIPLELRRRGDTLPMDGTHVAGWPHPVGRRGSVVVMDLAATEFDSVEVALPPGAELMDGWVAGGDLHALVQRCTDPGTEHGAETAGSVECANGRQEWLTMRDPLRGDPGWTGHWTSRGSPSHADPATTSRSGSPTPTPPT